MKSIVASIVFTLLAISSATVGVAALPSGDTGMPDVLHCCCGGMLNKNTDSTGSIARDSSSGDTGSTTAGTRVALNLVLKSR